MDRESELPKGWKAGSRFVGPDASSMMGASYIDSVNSAIDAFENAINNCNKTTQTDPSLRGFLFEEWSAGTFNVDAVASGSKDWAHVPKSTSYNSPDIVLESGKVYSAKARNSGYSSAIHQTVDTDTGELMYQGMERLVPSDQLDAAIETAKRRAWKTRLKNPELSDAFKETQEKLTDRVVNSEGVQSRPITREELDEIVQERKSGTSKASDHGITTTSAVDLKYMMGQANRAGLTSAAITVALQIAPELVSLVGQLLKTGEVDAHSIRQLGLDAISASGKGYIRGAVSSAIYIECAKGAFGEALKNINPALLGLVTTLVVDTCWNAIKVAQGKMTPLEMGDAFANAAVAGFFYLAGAKLGGMIGQAIGFQVPVIGFVVGSLVGAGASIAYNWSKKKLISICVDTGFTCFGLVDQDYTIPHEILKQLGVEFAEPGKAGMSKAQLDRAAMESAVPSHAKVDKVEFVMLRRGLIGVNRVGYIQ